eukprot:1065357-Alexandrium_andersonii.AAC.1
MHLRRLGASRKPLEGASCGGGGLSASADAPDGAPRARGATPRQTPRMHHSGGPWRGSPGG